MFIHLLLFPLLFSIVSNAVIPVPSPPNPIPEPPTMKNFAGLTKAEAAEKHSTALEITSAADHLPRETEKPKTRKRVRLHSHKTRQIEIIDRKCNDENLQEIMKDAISVSLSTSKMIITERAARDFGATFDVICSRGHFSYFVDASIYCEVTSFDVTCLAYRNSTVSDVQEEKKAKKQEKTVEMKKEN